MKMTLKQEVERGIGDRFIQWYNQKMGKKYKFDRFGADPPDLLYRDSWGILPVEITTEYYDQNDARQNWQNVRNNSATGGWSGVDFDQSLVKRIIKRIEKKCEKTYDQGTILVIGIYPRLTTNKEFHSMLNTICLPTKIPFSGIYVGGKFPFSLDTMGGYFYWQLR